MKLKVYKKSPISALLVYLSGSFMRNKLYSLSFSRRGNALLECSLLLFKQALMLSILTFSTAIFAISEGEQLPAIKVLAADGKSSLQFDGKVAILNFWATWCEACKVELVEMKNLFASLDSRNDVMISYISLDKDAEKARRYFEEEFGKESVMVKRLAFDSAFSAADTLGVDSFPMTLVLNKSGKIVKIQRGFKVGEKSTESLLEVAKNL